MSDEKKESSKDSNDPKVKFLEALGKKKQGQGFRINNIAGSPKILGGQSDGNAPKMFRRKSGSS